LEQNNYSQSHIQGCQGGESFKDRNNTFRPGGVAQVAERLPSEREALSQTPIPQTNNQTNQNKTKPASLDMIFNQDTDDIKEQCPTGLCIMDKMHSVRYHTIPS
jgi:hypothetical protein